MRLPEEFPRAVTDEAEWVSEVPSLPELDRHDLPLITIDLPGSMDLDQADAPGGAGPAATASGDAIADGSALSSGPAA